MVIWINDIWFYFIDCEHIKEAFLCPETGNIYFENMPDTLKIPKVYSRIELLRKFIQNSGDKKLIRIVNDMSDAELPRFYHIHYAPYVSYDGNPYSFWREYGKRELFLYASKWCGENGIPYTDKMVDIDEKLGYLNV